MRKILTMDILFSLLLVLITSGGVFATAYFIMQSFFKNENRRRQAEIRKSTFSVSMPIRFQAYERVIIFLERLHPNNLVLRVNKINFTAQQLHAELLKTIRAEYEHNLSQQIYLSPGAWELVKTAKEETVKLVHIASSKVNDQSKGQELATIILQITSSVEKMPSQVAIDYIKQEVTQLY